MPEMAQELQSEPGPSFHFIFSEGTVWRQGSGQGGQVRWEREGERRQGTVKALLALTLTVQIAAGHTG